MTDRVETASPYLLPATPTSAALESELVARPHGAPQAEVRVTCASESHLVSTTSLRIAGFLAASILLGLICLTSAQAAFSLPVWTQPDEPAHYEVVRAFEVLHRYPLVTQQVPVGAGLPTMAPFLNNETFQPPLNYLVFAVADFGARAFMRVVPAAPPLTPVWVMRLINTGGFVALGFLLWLCARAIRPGDHVLSVGMVASLLLYRHVLVEATRIGNDVLVAVLVTFAGYLAIRWRESRSVRRAALVGLVIGTACLAKQTGALGILFVAVVWLVPGDSARWSLRLRQVAVAAAASLALVVPWLLLQHHRFGDWSGSAELRRIVPSVLTDVSPTREHIEWWLRFNLDGVFTFREMYLPVHPDWVDTLVLVAVLILVVAGLLAAATDHRLPRFTAPLVLTWFSVPLALLAMTEAAGVFLGSGRYDLVGALPGGLLLALGPSCLGKRYRTAGSAIGLAVIMGGGVLLGLHDWVAVRSATGVLSG